MEKGKKRNSLQIFDLKSGNLISPNDISKEELLEAILDAIPEKIVYHDDNMNVIWTNKETADVLGKNREFVAGQNFYKVTCKMSVPCRDCPVELGCYGDKLKKVERIENKLIDGRLYFTRSCEVDCQSGPLTGRLVITQDITDLKYRYGINETLSLISDAFSSSSDLSYTYKKLIETLTNQFNYPLGTITLYNQATDEVEIMGSVDFSGRMMNSKDRYPASQTFTGLVLDKTDILRIENVSQKKEYENHILAKVGVNTIIVVPLHVEGKTIGAMTLADFERRTDAELLEDALRAVANRLGVEILRKRVEDMLKQEQSFTNAITNNPGSLILLVDKAGRIELFSKSCESLTGFSHAELRGRYYWECLVPQVKREEISTFFSFDTGINIPDVHETEWLTKDGRIRIISFTNTIIDQKGKSDSHVLSIGIDVTDQRKIEREIEIRKRQLLQADKMASLGVLVSGVAHEINNPNNFIMMNSPLLREAWEDIIPILNKYRAEHGEFTLAGIPYSSISNQFSTLFDGIQEGSERIQRIVQSLKNYAREETPDMIQQVDINKAVETALRLLSNLIKKSTNHLTTDLKKRIPPVKGSIHRLEQVIINLVQNACQALPDPGKGISIKTTFKKSTREVIVQIDDEGIGMEKHQLDQAIDPFFTTKRDIGGTGLGLSVCAGIVDEHKGRLEFTSEPGQGTSVRLILPEAP